MTQTPPDLRVRAGRVISGRTALAAVNRLFLIFISIFVDMIVFYNVMAYGLMCGNVASGCVHARSHWSHRTRLLRRN